MEGLRDRIRNHIKWAEGLAMKLSAEDDFEIVTEPILSLFSFRHLNKNVDDLDAHNMALVNAINDDGRIYLTQTKHEGILAIRFVAGQFDMQESDAQIAFEAITQTARKLAL